MDLSESCTHHLALVLHPPGRALLLQRLRESNYTIGTISPSQLASTTTRPISETSQHAPTHHRNNSRSPRSTYRRNRRALPPHQLGIFISASHCSARLPAESLSPIPNLVFLMPITPNTNNAPSSSGPRRPRTKRFPASPHRQPARAHRRYRRKMLS